MNSVALLVQWTRATFFGWALGFALILVFIALSGMVGTGDSQFPVVRLDAARAATWVTVTHVFQAAAGS